MIQVDTRVPELPSDDEILAVCEQRQHLVDKRRCFTYPSDEAPLAFVKHSDEAEVRNHKYILELVAQMLPQERSSLHVPQIYRCIRKGAMVYIVMEYVKGETAYELLKVFPEDLLKDKLGRICQAIKLLLSVRIPQDTTPGPVGGGIIKHPIFKDGIASIQYKSVDDLQQHLNKVANRMPNNNCNIDFSEEQLCLCFSDLYEGNFIFTENSDLYLIDFEALSHLPSSFMTYTLNQPRPICRAIKDEFDLPTRNLDDMVTAGYYFMKCWRHVGLEDENEEYEKMQKRRRKHILA